MSKTVSKYLISKSEVQEKIDTFIKNGYEIYHCNEPSEAKGGFLALGKEEDEHIFMYNLFDEAFYVRESIVTPEELLEFVESKDVYGCDKPTNLLIGFVSYNLQTKTAITKRCSSSRIRRAGDVGEKLFQYHKKLKNTKPDNYICVKEAK